MKNFWIAVLKPKAVYAKWLVFIAVFGVLAVGVSGHLDLVKEYLGAATWTFKIGSFEISVYKALRSALIVILIFWVAAIVSDFAEKRIGQFKKIGSTKRALIIKTLHISIYILAGLIALDIIGIDLTTLTVFSGALGIGLGFGLQKIASNFISGLILLLEKSVEEDDLVELSDGTSGFVRKASARYTLIETFDGKEILVPNEDLITSRVINWTFTNSKARVEIPIGVSYSSDIEKAQSLALKAAMDHPSCIPEPKPKCYLRGFGDNSVNFVLHFWVADIVDGRWEPQSEVMFSIWKKYHESGIEFPFPQRDIHIKSPELFRVKDDAK